jgi:hypothetical protein
MKTQSFHSFIWKMSVVHTVTYFIAGAMAYQLLTKQFYEGPNAIFTSFMRTPAEPDSWHHVMRWFIPAQILRGILMALALLPFYELMLKWSYRKRFFALASLYLVFGCWACAVAAPGTIEGFVYNKPFITPYVHAIVQPEILVQGILLAAWLSRWMGKAPQNSNHN